MILRTRPSLSYIAAIAVILAPTTATAMVDEYDGKDTTLSTTEDGYKIEVRDIITNSPHHVEIYARPRNGNCFSDGIQKTMVTVVKGNIAGSTHPTISIGGKVLQYTDTAFGCDDSAWANFGFDISSATYPVWSGYSELYKVNLYGSKLSYCIEVTMGAIKQGKEYVYSITKLRTSHGSC